MQRILPTRKRGESFPFHFLLIQSAVERTFCLCQFIFGGGDRDHLYGESILPVDVQRGIAFVISFPGLGASAVKNIIRRNID